MLGGGGGVDTAKIVSAVGPSTALIRSDAGETGSGWALDAGQGLVVTNGHVINDGSTFQVGVRGKLRPAAVVADAPCEDLAILKVDPATGLKTLPLGFADAGQGGRRRDSRGLPAERLVGRPADSHEGRRLGREDAVPGARPRHPAVPERRPDRHGAQPRQLRRAAGERGREADRRQLRRAHRTSRAATIQNQNFAIGVDRVKQVVNYLRTGKSLQWTGLNLVYHEPEFFTHEQPDDRHRHQRRPSRARRRIRPGSTAAKPLLIIGVNGKRMENTLASYCAATAGIQSGQEATFTVQDISDPANPSKPRALELKFA